MRGRRAPGQPSALKSLRTLPRMLSAIATGRYHGTSPAQAAKIVLALGYIASPVDLMPEALLMGIGLLDDGVVLAWLAGAVLAETDAFLAWEKEQRGGRPSTPAAGGGDFVVGEVLR